MSAFLSHLIRYWHIPRWHSIPGASRPLPICLRCHPCLVCGSSSRACVGWCANQKWTQEAQV